MGEKLERRLFGTAIFLMGSLAGICTVMPKTASVEDINGDGRPDIKITGTVGIRDTFYQMPDGTYSREDPTNKYLRTEFGGSPIPNDE